MSPAPGSAGLSVVIVHPDLLGTYGDGGNGLVLARRAAWRGIAVELVEARSDRPLPSSGNLYCLGGGEDAPQVRAATALAREGALVRCVEGGAALLAVCAGFQIIGRSFPSAEGKPIEGLGLLDVVTSKGRGPRAVGELAVEPTGGLEGMPVLTGFENHGGISELGPGTSPLGRVLHGTGNGVAWGTGRIGVDGARAGKVVGTYLHGPVLARNPALADRLLAWAMGGEVALAPLDDAEEEALRLERLGAVHGEGDRRGRAHVRRWRPRA